MIKLDQSEQEIRRRKDGGFRMSPAIDLTPTIVIRCFGNVTVFTCFQ
jgi:hypothetical protein